MKKLIYLLIIAVACFGCKKKHPEEDEFIGPSGVFTDSRDEHTYKWVRIGNQIWMAENLAYLPSVNSQYDGSTTDPRYYVYDFSGTNIDAAKSHVEFFKYGVLYNWAAATKSCPKGWHIPTLDEWEQLALTIQKQHTECSKTGDNWKNVGKYLKTTTGWSVGDGTDEYGFSAIPGGWRNTHYCDFEGNSGYWWSSSQTSDSRIVNKALSWAGYYLTQDSLTKDFGLGIRCIKN